MSDVMERCGVADCSSFADVPVIHETVEGTKTRCYCEEHSEVALRSENARQGAK